METARTLTADQIRKLIEKLGGEKAVECFLRDELLQVAELPQSRSISGHLQCTVFVNGAAREAVHFSTKELKSRSVHFTVRDGQTGDQLFADTVQLERDEDGILNGGSELPVFAKPYTIECELV